MDYLVTFLCLFQVLFGIIPVNSSVLECKEKVADIIFALDSSDSIWPGDFVKQTDFVQKVVDSLTIGPNNIQVGLVTFGTRIQPNFQLTDHQNKRSVLTAIQSVYALGEGTNTGATLKYIREEMFKKENGGRKWAAKIVILITDGVSRDRKETMMEASLSRLDDIEIYTIGVGYSVDAMELDVIASNPKEKHQFLVENYNSLQHILHSFTATSCDVLVNDQPPVEKPVVGDPDHPKHSCKSKPAEVYFVLDSSSSIWHPDFIKQLDFVREVVSLFDMGKNKTRVGVITYSDGVHPVIPLDAYDMEEFELKLKKIPYLTGGTSTEAAIQFLREYGFSKDNARSDVAHVGIVVTDGQSRSFSKTVKEAKLAHQQGIQLFAIGVGKAVDEEEMLEIASDPNENYVFRVDDYDALKKIESLLAVKACEVPAPQVLLAKLPSDQPSCSLNRVTDMVFVIDSTSLGHHNTQIITKTVARINSEFPKAIDLRSGIVKEKDPEDGYLDLSYYHKTNWFINRLRPDTREGLRPLLHHVRRHSFRQSAGGRRNSEKVSVIFVDSELMNSSESILEAKRLKFQNVKVYIVTIGSTYNQQEVRKLSTFPSEHYVINFQTFENMLMKSDDIIKRICEGH